MGPTAKKPGRITQSLRATFGLDQLRPGQREVILSVLAGHDTLALMPTGAGKSLCYQLPALHLEGTTVVVSPLISLMKDQADKLLELGLNAVEMNSTVTGRVEKDAIEQITDQRSEFVFTTPERMSQPDFLETLKDADIDFVVIDEAHCISQWGHDFRPAYLSLKQALRELGNPPVLALTATATEAVQKDIRRQLGRKTMRVFNEGIYRANLAFEVCHVSGDKEKREALIRLLVETQGTGIIYAATIKHVNDLTAHLVERQLPVESYHGKLPMSARTAVQERFMAGGMRAVVATNAFGLGIDKPDIRFVVHYDMPGSVEAYYQEAGRAGRDGEPARCVLLYDARDRNTQLFFLGGRYPEARDLRAVYRALSAYAKDGGMPFARLEEKVPAVATKKIRVVLSWLKDVDMAAEPRVGRFAVGRRKPKAGDFERVALAYRQRIRHDRDKLEQMENYAVRAACRWKVLHTYFGEDMPDELCGVCDNCVRGIAAEA